MPTAFPYQISGKGKTEQVDAQTYIRGLIEQVLFTMQGERVNLPQFGTGIEQRVFSPNSDEMNQAVSFLVQSNLIHWLSEYIQVQEVSVTADGAQMLVNVKYVILPQSISQEVTYERTIEQ